MEHVVLIIHLILALAIIGLVLLQRSEGGGLGIGGGSGGLGGLASAGTTASVLTRATAICAFCFFGTSLLLGILSGMHRKAPSLMEALDSAPPVAAAVQDVPVDTQDSALALEKAPTVPVE